MPSPLAHSARAAPDQSALGWLILIPLGCLILGQAALALTGALPVLDGSLGDTDPYMRLARVMELHDSGSWFDSRFPRIGPPDGHVQHWTRPLDALLLIGAWLLEPFLGFDHALYVWGVLISPVCLALTVLAFAWAAEPLLDRDTRLFACLAVLLQPTVTAYASVGRPDHHSLLVLLFVILLGLTLRLLADPADRRSAVLAGVVAALAIWISPEALVFIAPSLAALGCCWMLGDDGMAPGIQRYLIALTLGLTAALVIERGPVEPWLIENDRISLLHVVLFGSLSLLWPLVAALPRRLGPAGEPDRASGEDFGRRRIAWPWSRLTLAIRAGAAALGGLAVATVMLLLFPELRSGPLGHVDPLYARVRLARISEIQPLVSLSALAEGDFARVIRRVILYVGLAAPAVPFLLLRLLREPGQAQRLWAYVGIALGIFLGLGIYQLRWSSYAQLLVLLPYSALVGWLLRELSAQVSAAAAPLCRAPLILICLLWPFFLVQLLPPTRTATAACPLAEVARGLEQAAGSEPRTVMALADYGPELLYRTRHSVLSIPNHRPQPGFTATYHALTATSDSMARAEIGRAGTDLILLCPSTIERATFAVAGTTAPTLYERLVDGDAPAWLRALPLEGDARLYEVIRGGGAAAGLAPRRP